MEKNEYKDWNSEFYREMDVIKTLFRIVLIRGSLRKVERIYYGYLNLFEEEIWKIIILIIFRKMEGTEFI